MRGWQRTVLFVALGEFVVSEEHEACSEVSRLCDRSGEGHG